MDFTLNIKIEATPEFCQALDNIANTITSAFCVTAAAANADAETLRRAAESQAPANTEPHAQTAAVPVTTEPPAPAPVPTVPTTAQEYTQDQLALAASGLMDTGKLAELQQLLASFQVDSLVKLPKAQYGAFATKLRELGAKI